MAGSVDKKEHLRVVKHGANLGSPRVVADIDADLADIRQEWVALLNLRQIAVTIHKDTSTPPAMPNEVIVVEPAQITVTTANQTRPRARYTVESLATEFKTHPKSQYQGVRHATRTNYDGQIKRLIAEHGPRPIAEIKASDITQWYAGWTANGAITMGSALVNTFRRLVGFGATVLEDDDCERLAGIMRIMRFEQPKPRTEKLTVEQAVAIRKKANEMGFHSIALAQAFQIDCKLAQKDVIGEWVPLDEPVKHHWIGAKQKWARGLIWDEIDDNLILRHVTSRELEQVEIDLHTCPMVMAELKWVGPLAAKSGPVIICEQTDEPYTAISFRRLWRTVATAAGIPPSVRNMDSNADDGEDDDD